MPRQLSRAAPNPPLLIGHGVQTAEEQPLPPSGGARHSLAAAAATVFALAELLLSLDLSVQGKATG